MAGANVLNSHVSYGRAIRPCRFNATCAFFADGVEIFGSPFLVEFFNGYGRTERCAVARLYYLERMKLVEQAAIGASAELSNYILKAVTEGWSYDVLKVQLDIPCCKDVYYDCYRRFFWLLNKERD